MKFNLCLQRLKFLEMGRISPKFDKTWSGCRKSVEYLNVLSALTICILIPLLINLIKDYNLQKLVHLHVAIRCL
jgi:hypothetical protein